MQIVGGHKKSLYFLNELEVSCYNQKKRYTSFLKRKLTRSEK